MVCENYPITSAVLCDTYVAKAKCPGHLTKQFHNCCLMVKLCVSLFASNLAEIIFLQLGLWLMFDGGNIWFT